MRHRQTGRMTRSLLGTPPVFVIIVGCSLGCSRGDSGGPTITSSAATRVDNAPPNIVFPSSATSLVGKNPIVGSGKPAWREVVSSVGKYKVRMPGEPASTRPDNVTAMIPPGIVYSVAYFDHPTFVDERAFAELLNNARDSKIAGGSTLLSEKQITTGKYQGREFVFDVQGLKWYQRDFAVGRRLYTLRASYPVKLGIVDDAASVQTFFTSFEVIP